MKITLISRQNNSKFVIYQLSPGIHTIKDITIVVYTMGDHEGILQSEYDDDTTKTNFILARFGSTFGTLRFDERSFFNTLLGFTPYWDYTPTNAIHADSSGKYSSEKILYLSTIDKTHLKCVVINGSIQNGLRQPILLSFVSDKKPGYRLFCEPETIHCRKIKISVLNTITFIWKTMITKKLTLTEER